MKILHVVTLSELGGSQSVIVSLSKAAIVDGHRVMVAASANGDLWNILPEKVEKWPIATLKREVNLVKDIQSYLELKRIQREFCPDVIHLHSSKIGVLGRLAFPSRKIIYTVHGFDSIRIAYRHFLPIEKFLKRKGSHIVAVSRYDYENLLAEGIHCNVTAIYNGIEDYQLLPDKPLSVAMEDIGRRIKENSAFSVMCIARISPQKNFDLFCQVAHSFIGQGVDFYWIGNKEQPPNLPENVTCLGEIPTAHYLLPHANLFFLPTEYEGMPISILEALCYGVPVVASAVGGIPETLDGKNGFALPNEVTPFREKILHLRNNKTTYDEASREARASYLRNFTIGKMYGAYLALYKKVAET